MFYLINHNSYILFAFLLWVTVSFFAFKKMTSPGNSIVAVLLALVLVGIFSIVRPKQASAVEGNFIQDEIGGGKAVLLEFQSPY